MKKYVYSIGVDIGTGGSKTTIVRSDGAVVSSAGSEYPTACPLPQWSEQDPDLWYGSVSTAIKEAIEKADLYQEDIVSVCVNGQPHTLVLLNNQNELLRPAIVWNDQRSSEQSNQLRESFGDLFMRIGFNQVNPTWTISILAWIKQNEPQTWNSISKIMLPKDYIRFRLTGRWATDWTDAAGTLLADVGKKQWSRELCGTIQLPMNLLPEIVSPLEVAGRITKEASLETGILEGTEVVAGSCDPAAELFGTGLISKGQLAIKLATAGVVFMTSDKPNPHPQTLTYPHVLPHMWFSVAATNSCGSSVRWFRNIFCEEEIKVSNELGRNPYELMDAEAGKVETGSDGLLYHPYLQGERSPYWDPDLRGSFTGIRMNHRRRHFIRSIFEGVSFSIKDCLSLILMDAEKEEIQKILDEKVLLLGGGSKSSLWSQILSDVLGTSLWKLESVDASFGSALIGGVGVGMFESPQEAINKCVRVSDKIKPNSQNNASYAKQFTIYKKIHDALAEIYREV